MSKSGFVGNVEEASLGYTLFLEVIYKSGKEAIQKFDVFLAERIGMPAELLSFNSVNLYDDLGSLGSTPLREQMADLEIFNSALVSKVDPLIKKRESKL